MGYRPPSKRYVESLQARIALLESQLVSLGKSTCDTSLGAPLNTVNEDPDPDSTSELSDVDIDSPGRTTEDFVREITHTYGSLTLNENGQLSYFGPQSNFNLLHSFVNQTPANPAHAYEETLTDRTFLTPDIQIPLEVQEHLLELYFRWQNPWLYLVEKEVFLRDFHASTPSRYCTPSLLLAIFSVAARYSDRTEVREDPENPGSAGNEYAKAANKLLLVECENPSVPTVQAAALLAIRWMAENKEPAGWLYTGSMAPVHTAPLARVLLMVG